MAEPPEEIDEVQQLKRELQQVKEELKQKDQQLEQNKQELQQVKQDLEVERQWVRELAPPVSVQRNVSTRRHIPGEVWMMVTEAVVNEDAVAFPANHEITRTLRALLTVNRVTSMTARRLLLKHCLWIDCEWKLYSLNRCLRGLSEVGILDGLLLAPCWSGNMEDLEEPIVDEINTLLYKIGHELRKVVVEIPGICTYHEPEHYLRSTTLLRRAFMRCEKMEEFTNTLYAPFTDTMHKFADCWMPAPTHEFLWTGWSHLRHLSLYEVTLDHVASSVITTRMPQLRVLVLGNGDMTDACVQGLYLGMQTPLDVVFIEGYGTFTPIPEFFAFLERLKPWKSTLQIRNEDDLTVSFRIVIRDHRNIPEAKDSWSIHRERDYLFESSVFIRAKSLDRSLWQVDGMPFFHQAIE